MMKGMVFAERYKLEDFIGQGGMSLVYRAVDVRTGHSVAVKILKSEYNSDKEFLERFQREAQAASLMSHHNLVNLLDVGVEGEYRYLVLEYVNGNTLKDVIRQKGRLNYQTAIQIAVRILSALQHAHDNGIIHRDIKPQNVLIHADGHVKVSDFGIARMTNAFTISKGDTVVGSVHYSSPEQATGSVVEATSDIYSTGVVMYEMLTGRVPFVGDTPVAVAMQHVKDPPPPITDYAPETPPAVVAVVMKALEKDPKKRFQSAREMADALMKAKDGRLAPADVTGTTDRRPPVGKPSVAQRVREVSPRTQQEAGRRLSQTARRKPVRRRRKIAQMALSALAAAGVLALLTLGVIQVYTRVSRSAIAPDVVGLSVGDAQAMARREGLNWQQTDINHDSLPAGTVISQIPEANTPMEKGDSLLATVSLGPVSAVMPDMTGLSYEDAASRLKERGFGNVVIIKTVSASAEGMVLGQNPQPGQSFTIGQTVELTVSGGSTMVPEVTGIYREEAVARLHDSDLTEGAPVYVEVTGEDKVGLVISQSPAAGTMAVLDAPVTLTVGIESEPYQGELGLKLPAAAKERALRVALVVNGQEHTEYEGVVAAGSDAPMLIPISSNVEGNVLCRVYVDDVLYSEETIALR
ncbi:MAG: Stk1 family PASTA domain-containing Ser/Thr kinase [Clostridiales bacterium]|nr:Stk1 family PASTA domain-containing Ser/Thr kinase [Clostridiales bacterium]MDO4350560.1 Stk1 family PASTA domain-containing Ser/Thr kinase [Eubacteriales bacterium]MDY4007245.1 Stk1 family PASTA domain-containing Ser/Thr kinase [Candidatus Limiplasma sp.]